MKFIAVSFICVFIILSTGANLFAEIINVPDDFDFIQDAVNNTNEGDTVLVEAGRYNERVGMPERNIVLMSRRWIDDDEDVIAETIIDAVDINRSAVRTGNGTDERTVIDGFTIRNGNTDYGGGIYFALSGATLRYLIVEDNVASRGGGGIYITRNSNAVIENCIVRDNNGFIGGGIVVIGGSSATISDCLIETNFSQEHGAGIHVTQTSTLNMEDVVVRANEATLFGGGVHGNEQSQLNLNRVQIVENRGGNGGGLSVRTEAFCRLENVDIIDNWTESSGGGIYSAYGSGHATDCTITGNVAESEAGGVYASGGTFEFERCLISENTSDASGSIFIFLAEGSFTNCTIANNIVNESAEIRMANGILSMLNTILWNDERPAVITTDDDPDTLSIHYCDISGGEDGLILQDDDVVEWGDANINADPQFADPDEGDYRLTAESPCIDAGDPDFERDPDHSRADIGAFYFHRNQPPYIICSIPHVVIDEDSDVQILAFLDTLFADWEEDDIHFEIEAPEELGLEIIGDTILSIHPALNFFGDSIEARIYGVDEQRSEPLSFMVTVNGINDPPMEFGLLTPENGTSISGSDTLSDHDTLSFSWEESVDPDGDNDIHYCLILTLQWADEDIDTTRYDVEMETSFLLYDESRPERWYYGGDLLPSAEWWVQAVSGEDTTECSERYHFDFIYDSVDEKDELPTEFALSPPYPNPFNSTTSISFGLPGQSPLTVTIHDITGRLVETLINGNKTAGRHTVTWEAKGYTSGLYFIRINAGDYTDTQKLMLIK